MLSNLRLVVLKSWTSSYFSSVYVTTFKNKRFELIRQNLHVPRNLSTNLCAMIKSELPQPEFDWSYLCSVDNSEKIRTNISNRKGVGDIDRVIALWKSLNTAQQEGKHAECYALSRELHNAAATIPNKTHPECPVGDETCARQLACIGEKKDFRFSPKSAVEIGERLDVLRTQEITNLHTLLLNQFQSLGKELNQVLDLKFVGHSSGPRTYYLKGALAQLEHALVQFTLDILLQNFNFTLVSVPNVVKAGIIESCGFKTSGERTQVYQLVEKQHDHFCLAGTGEFPLAGLFVNRHFNEEDLPNRVATVSHCYRAETSEIARESGLYRVHQFTKVEMFALTANEMNGSESDAVLNDFVYIEKSLFTRLGLHFRVLEMPTQELGASAYRKIDMEAWLPAKQFWGEISSTSNCTDFQSRRLGLKYTNKHGITKHCHTVNGTACAVPRMLIAILENYQQPDGTVLIPPALRQYMGNLEVMANPIQSFPFDTSGIMKQFRNQDNANRY